MNRIRALLLLGLAVLAVVWVSSATAPGRQTVITPTPARTAASADEGDPFGLFEATARLQTRLDSAGPMPEPARNPFRFGDPPVARAPVARPAPVLTLPPVPAVPPPPALTLSGIAERTRDGQSVRTAIIVAPDKLYFVAAGDRVTSRYEVVAVGTDAVELTDLLDLTTLRLALR
jgi:hypothetical protein